MSNSPQDVHKKVLGRKGEKLAAEYLKKLGMKIVKRNYKTPFGEADIIAEFQDEIVFVEVKTRTGEAYGAPSEAVTQNKKQRYYQMAKLYGLSLGIEPNARFDVVEVWADGRISHIEYAF